MPKNPFLFQAGFSSTSTYHSVLRMTHEHILKILETFPRQTNVLVLYKALRLKYQLYAHLDTSF